VIDKAALKLDGNAARTREVLAKQIVDLAKLGERDRQRLADGALARFKLYAASVGDHVPIVIRKNFQQGGSSDYSGLSAELINQPHVGAATASSACPFENHRIRQGKSRRSLRRMREFASVRDSRASWRSISALLTMASRDVSPEPARPGAGCPVNTLL
jgi:hypothetical protein